MTHAASEGTTASGMTFTERGNVLRKDHRRVHKTKKTVDLAKTRRSAFALSRGCRGNQLWKSSEGWGYLVTRPRDAVVAVVVVVVVSYRSECGVRVCVHHIDGLPGVARPKPYCANLGHGLSFTSVPRVSAGIS